MRDFTVTKREEAEAQLRADEVLVGAGGTDYCLYFSAFNDEDWIKDKDDKLRYRREMRRKKRSERE